MFNWELDWYIAISIFSNWLQVLVIHVYGNYQCYGTKVLRGNFSHSVTNKDHTIVLNKPLQLLRSNLQTILVIETDNRSKCYSNNMYVLCYCIKATFQINFFQTTRSFDMKLHRITNHTETMMLKNYKKYFILHVIENFQKMGQSKRWRYTEAAVQYTVTYLL